MLGGWEAITRNRNALLAFVMPCPLHYQEFNSKIQGYVRLHTKFGLGFYIYEKVSKLSHVEATRI